MSCCFIYILGCHFGLTLQLKIYSCLHCSLPRRRVAFLGSLHRNIIVTPHRNIIVTGWAALLVGNDLLQKVTATGARGWLGHSVQQSGRKCGVGSQHTCSHFFRLLARILTIFDKKYRILTCRDKRESYLIVLQQYNVEVC